MPLQSPLIAHNTTASMPPPLAATQLQHCSVGVKIMCCVTGGWPPGPSGSNVAERQAAHWGYDCPNAGALKDWMTGVAHTAAPPTMAPRRIRSRRDIPPCRPVSGFSLSTIYDPSRHMQAVKAGRPKLWEGINGLMSRTAYLFSSFARGLRRKRLALFQLRVLRPRPLEPVSYSRR
jgi:hypothetical protein